MYVQLMLKNLVSVNDTCKKAETTLRLARAALAIQIRGKNEGKRGGNCENARSGSRREIKCSATYRAGWRGQVGK